MSLSALLDKIKRRTFRVEDVQKLREAAEVMRSAIYVALIYDPDVDRYKIKHTAYPKLKAAKEMADLICEEPK